MRKRILLVILIALLFTGCLGRGRITSVNETGDLIVSVDFQSLNPDVAKVDLKIIRASVSQTDILTRAQDSTTFAKLSEGKLSITGIAKDRSGKALYQGASTVVIVAGTTHSVELSLSSKFGDVTVFVDFESLEPEVTKVDLEIMKESIAETAVLTRENQSTTFSYLSEGLWHISGIARNSAGVALCQGTSSATVVAETLQSVTLPFEDFDESLGQLSLTYKRDLVIGEDTEAKIAFIKVYRADSGYEAIREIDISGYNDEFTIELQLPVAGSYAVRTLFLGENNELIEFGGLDRIHVPADMLTSVTVPMHRPEYEVMFPNRLRSGSNTDQIIAEVPIYLRPWTYAYVWIGLNPWEKNGVSGLWSTNTSTTGWIINAVEGTFPKVTEATKLYYQVGVGANAHMVPDIYNWPYHYVTNVEKGEELPYVWLYP